MPGRNDHQPRTTLQQFHEDLETLKHLDGIEVKPDGKVWEVTARLLARLRDHPSVKLQLMAATAAQELLDRRDLAGG